MRLLRARLLLALPAAAALVGAGLAATGSPASPAAAGSACPAGYQSYAEHASNESRERAAASSTGSDALHRAVDQIVQDGLRTGSLTARAFCVNTQHPESPGELAVASLAREVPRVAPVGSVRQGAFASALGQRQAMPATVPGSQGVAAPYGTGPLVVDDPAYPEVNGLGLGDNSARVDNFSYDPGTKRLFAAVGSAGIYLSTDLGLHWASISDRMPSTISSGVGYAPARGARRASVIALTGDGTFGSSGFTGFGAYYTTDLDAALAAHRQPSWAKAAGLPDGALGFTVAVDPTNADVVYAATSLGLYRSTDAGRSYRNVALPVGAVKDGGASCAGVSNLSARPECLFASVVTDVKVQSPGGTTGTKGGAVVAAVGWRGGNRLNPDGTVQAPGNGIYGSDTGAPGTFIKLTSGDVDRPDAFTEQTGIGRIALGAATGPEQDHGYLYALVQDARLLNGGLKGIDIPVQGDQQPKPPVKICDPVLGTCPLTGGTVLEGLYVSPDFGRSWRRVADDNQISRNPASGSSLVGVGTAIGYEPGVQAWYDMWVQPDPTQAAGGVPTRLLFGLEEVWENESVPGAPNPVDGVGDTFKVVGRYFAGSSCQLLSLGLPTCPTNRSPQVSTTTHPDQHAALFVPVDPKDMSKGVHLFVGNDGGAYRQDLTPSTTDDTTDGDGSSYGVGTGDIDNGHWGRGINSGFDALLPYHATMAKDGTVYAGLQDNGHMKIDPRRGLKRFETYGGDGFFSAVDPNNSKTAYEEYTGGAMSVTVDGGTTWKSITPPITGALFANPFVMDPRDAKHLLTAGREVVERLGGPDGDWVTVFDLGTAQHRGSAAAQPTATDVANKMTAVDLVGASAYVGFCGTCDILNTSVPFRNGLATNVGGSAPAKKGTAAGWHVAAAKGLPNRYITSVAIEPSDPKTVLVTLGGYTRRWTPPGTLGDVNAQVGSGHLFVSHDAGQSFRDVTANLPDVPATWVTLRGEQVVVGTDLGAFASSARGIGRTGFAPLQGLPAVPVNAITRSPRNPRELVLATNGRGVWTYTFARDVREPGVPAPPAPRPLRGRAVASYDFDSGPQGWTTATTDPLGRGWHRQASERGQAFAFPHYSDATVATLTSPAVRHPGGVAAVRFRYAIDTEPGYDPVAVQWSQDGTTWTTVDTLNGHTDGYPAPGSARTARFTVPAAGPLQVRFVLTSDDNGSFPLYDGVLVDDVSVLE